MASKNGLTEGEMNILSHAWQCFKTVPEIDYKKLAPLVGHVNPVSTSNAWARIKKKLETMGSSTGESGERVDDGLPSPGATTPSTTTTKAKTTKKETPNNGAGKAKETTKKPGAGQKRKAEDPLVKSEQDEEVSDTQAQQTPGHDTGKKTKISSVSNTGVGKENTTATGRMNNRTRANPDSAGVDPDKTPVTVKKDNKSGTGKKASGSKKPKLDNKNTSTTGQDGSGSGSDSETPKKTPNGHTADKPAKATKGKSKTAAKNFSDNDADPVKDDNSAVHPIADTKAQNKQAWQVGKDKSILKPHSLAGQVFPNLRDHSIVDDDGQPIDEDGNVIPEIKTNGIDRFDGRGLRHHEKAEIDEQGNHRIYTVKKDGTKVYENEAESDGGKKDDATDESMLDVGDNETIGVGDDHEEELVHAI